MSKVDEVIDRFKERQAKTASDNEVVDGENGPPEKLETEGPSPEEEIADLRDQILRLHAEFDNSKKRAEREMLSFRKYANENLVRELLGQIDNLERALDHGKNDSPDDPLLAGVEMTLKGLWATLEKFGVSKIDSVGNAFDPNLHEAMMQQENGDVDEGTVLAEHQSGYVLHDRLIRPAMVVVSKKPADQSE